MEKRRIAWYRVVLVAGILFASIYLFTVFIAEDRKEAKMICKGLDIKIDNEGLLTEAKIKTIISSSGYGKNKPLNDEVELKIKKKLESSKHIRKVVEIYSSPDSILHIRLEQRIPMIRVNTSKSSFYCDETDFSIPIDYVYNVPIVSMYSKSSFPVNRSDTMLLRSLLDFVNFISKDEFLNAEIQQIIVGNQDNIELSVASGDYIVILGSLDDYKNKLKKLLTFYKKVIPFEGRTKYKTLDLRFKDQVVASFR